MKLFVSIKSCIIKLMQGTKFCRSILSGHEFWNWRFFRSWVLKMTILQVSQEDALTAINTVRFLSIDAVNKANSGHPGMPMGCAPMAYLLWTEFMRHNPSDPQWFNRDRFILSAGHGSMLLYSLLHLSGYESVSVSHLSLLQNMETGMYSVAPKCSLPTQWPFGSSLQNA